MKRLLLPILMLSLVACSSAPPRKEPTIADLRRSIIDIEPQVLTTVTRDEVQRSYGELAAETQNEGIKVMALERVADLELDVQQQKTTGARSREAAAIEPDEASYRDAIKQYERLLELYPDYEGNDRVLYQLAKAYDLAGELHQSLDAMTTLVQRYPDNPYFDEVQFRRGELLFSMQDFPAAEEAYGAVLARGSTSSYYDRALYKHGWSRFKRGDLDVNASLDSFLGVLDRSYAPVAQAESFAAREPELLEDVLRVLSLTFSIQKGPEAIADYFEQHGRRPYDYRVYQRLGELYLSQGRHDDAIESYRAFVRISPTHPQSPFFHLELMELYRQHGMADDLWLAKADFVTQFGVRTPYWSDKEPQLLAAITPFLKSNLSDLARHNHALAQKSGASEDYVRAGHWYGTYVDSFPDDAAAAGMNFLLAETLFESRDYLAAVIEYEKTAYDYPTHPQGAEAGYAALLAHQRLIEPLTDEARTGQRRAAIASAERFAKAYASDTRVTSVLLRVAEEYLDLKDYENAAVTAARIVVMQPPAPVEAQRTAWAVLASSNFELNRYIQAEQASRQRLQLAPQNDPNRVTYIELLAAAIYRQGEAARDAGDLGAAAKQFSRVAELAPDSSIRTAADYDALTAVLAQEKWHDAIPLLEGFMARNPTHQLAASATEKLAIAYEKIEDWSRAAMQYDLIQRTEPDPARRRALLWQSAELHERSGNLVQAIEVYQRFVAAYPQPLEQAMEARHRIATHYLKAADTDRRRYWLERIVLEHREPGVTPRTQFLAATAALELAEPTYAAFTAVRLVQPVREKIGAKRKLMQDSIAAYSKAADYGIADVVTASYFRIGAIYHDFSKDLLASERPSGLDADELEQYNLLLEDQAFPFEEKAIEFHEANAQNLTEGLYNEWTQKSLSALRELRPVRYAKTEKSDAFVQTLQ